jgi:hypothetical protein
VTEVAMNPTIATQVLGAGLTWRAGRATGIAKAFHRDISPASR